MDNLSRTQELLKGKSLTPEQVLYHIAAIECNQADIFEAIHSMKEELTDLEYSDFDCSMYFSEDVWTLHNMCYSRIYRALNNIDHVLGSMKAEMEDDDDT